MKLTVVLSLVLVTSWSPDHLRAQATLPIPATDTAFHAMVRTLVKDSLWAADQKAPQSYFVTSNESLVLLRRARVPVDSVSPSRFIGCAGQTGAAATGADATVGYVLSASVGPGIDSMSVAIHLTVGCRVSDRDGVRVTGHYCGWDVIREGSKWRVLRSRRCWKL